VQGYVVPCGYIVAEYERMSVVGDMECGVVLYIGSLAYAYVVYVSTDYRVEPDGGVGADLHVADYCSALDRKDGLVQFWIYGLER
jgi:hypothetical protein